MTAIRWQTTLVDDATTDDTLRGIIATVRVYRSSEFVQRAVKEIWDKCVRDGTANVDHSNAGAKKAFVKNLFEWVCRNHEYKLDPLGNEIIRTPDLTARLKHADCKKYSILIGSILSAAGIEPVFKHVTYKDEPDFTHIYVLVKAKDLEPHNLVHTEDLHQRHNYIVLDPTNYCKYDEEVKYATGTVYYLNGDTMKLTMMGWNKGVQHGGTWGNLNDIGGCAGKVLDTAMNVRVPGFEGAENMHITPTWNRTGANISPMHRQIHRTPHGVPAFMAPGMHNNMAMRAVGQHLQQTHPFLLSSPTVSAMVIKHNIHPHTALLYNIFDLDEKGNATETVELFPQHKQIEPGISGMGGFFKNLIKKAEDAGSKFIHKAEDIGKKVAEKFATVGYYIPRGAFLGLVDLNVHGLASHLLDVLNKNPKPIENFWTTVGGDVAKLKGAILTGSKKKQILGMEPIDVTRYSSAGALPIGQTVAALITAATPLIIMAAKMIHTVSPGSEADKTATNLAASATAAAADPGFNPASEDAMAKEIKDNTGFKFGAPGAGGASGGNLMGSAFGFFAWGIFDTMAAGMNPHLLHHFSANTIGLVGSSIAIIGAIVIHFFKITK